jgi:hypothetical protein
LEAKIEEVKREKRKKKKGRGHGKSEQAVKTRGIPPTRKQGTSIV